MKITIFGAHCTGKTTLVNALQDGNFPELAGYKFHGNITRRLAAKNFSINEAGDDATQLHVLAAHVEHYASPKAVLDRCALDGYVYTKYLHTAGKVSDSTVHLATNIVSALSYDHYFYLPIEFDPVRDGTRSVDPTFRRDIADLFEAAIRIFVPPSKVVRLTGTTEKRIETILNTIRQN